MNLNQYFSPLETDGVDLIAKLLKINPEQRITCKEALKHVSYILNIVLSFINYIYSHISKIVKGMELSL